ncbi:MAG: nucleotidyltransferase domain-containing protein [bacterium]|nr:nucleotidyltransferase domain-containing protein [bacterium]
MDIKFSKKHKETLKNLGIQAVLLFGSYSNGKPNELSDIDVGVLFENPEKYKDRTMDAYLKVYDILIDVLPKEYLKKRLDLKEHEVDIVFLQYAPVYLQHRALQDGKVLYTSEKQKFFTYKENITNRFCDLKYFYDLSFKALMARI